MKHYTIIHRLAPPPLDARDDAWWAGVSEGLIEERPYPVKCPVFRRTAFRAVWCADGLYLRYDCEDRRISAKVTIANGPVSRDSCVEFFVAPNPAKPLNYYNFEVNCVGTRLMGTHCDWGEGYLDRSLDIGLRVTTTVPGPAKAESPQDNGWAVVIGIPWAHFTPDAPHLPPQPGDLWQANFYRVGGQAEYQCASWSPLDHPKPHFHLPQCFAEITFAAP